jgi:hypothetical protein
LESIIKALNMYDYLCRKIGIMSRKQAILVSEERI